MTDPVLSLRGVGKHYKLGGMQPYQTLRDSLAGMFRRRAPSPEKGKGFWALRDVSFELKEGEVLGIVGRNGAGKSTLLKLLSRITTPDEGSITVRGRIGSLLEVGTGFHPELTGRENVFMNGVLLGMSHKEVARKFDEIVAFAGVDEFLDTPVKRYSSGMRVRLGFSVAAHLDPEILVIDEVLAVGDSEFQKKCLGRMNDVASQGRTVLFVSHQLEAIQSLCSRAIWLETGQIKADGSASKVVADYLNATHLKATQGHIRDRKDRQGLGRIKLVDMLCNRTDKFSVSVGHPLSIDFSVLNTISAQDDVSIRIGIRNSVEQLISYVGNQTSGDDLKLTPGINLINCHVPKITLVPGDYFLDIAISCKGILEDKILRSSVLHVLEGNFFGKGKSEHNGVLYLEQVWSNKQ